MKPMVIAHRGASGYRPEHSKEAFQLAFDLGAEAVEPDIVFSRDGVPVVRHDIFLGSTTNISEKKEFADRKRTLTFPGFEHTDWFVQDFDWAELQTLRCRERLPELRPLNDDFDQQKILRLSDVIQLILLHNAHLEERTGPLPIISSFQPMTGPISIIPPIGGPIAEATSGKIDIPLTYQPVSLVLEIKHTTFFTSIGFQVADLVMKELEDAGWFGVANHAHLIVESFELPILEELKQRGLDAEYVFLVEEGAPQNELFRAATEGSNDAREYASYFNEAGFAELAKIVDGISFKKALLLGFNEGHALIANNLARLAQAAGLKTYAWTLRPEARFLERVRQGETQIHDIDEEDSRLWQEEFAILMDAGLDGVFSDHPDLAIEIRRALHKYSR